jgi:putative tryptophan/tyrosine transport system substrate-binding protein
MRCSLVLVVVAVLSAGIAEPSQAQSPTKTARVGILSGASQFTPANAYFREAFLDALRQLGWAEGKNLRLEFRATEGRSASFAELAAELVELNVDVVVGANSQAVQALKDKTSTIPIVMVDASHPVEAGFVASLARPGGNITGGASQLNEVSAKAIELLREVQPGIARVGVLYTPSNAGSALSLKESIETIPNRLGVSVVPVPIESAADIDGALAAIDREGLHALQVHPTPIINTNRVRIAALLIERRLPTVTGFSTLVRDGILMSYGPDQVDRWRAAAGYVDRILRGANPADMPIEQPTKFLIVINLRAAKAIGVEFTPDLLTRADEVIE